MISVDRDGLLYQFISGVESLCQYINLTLTQKLNGKSMIITS